MPCGRTSGRHSAVRVVYVVGLLAACPQISASRLLVLVLREVSEGKHVKRSVLERSGGASDFKKEHRGSKSYAAYWAGCVI